MRVEIQLDPLDSAETPSIPIAAPIVDTTPPSRRAHRASCSQVVVRSSSGGSSLAPLAYTTWRHARSCTSCDPAALSHDASVLGDVSTALVVVGLAATGVGLYLWHRSASNAHVVPTAGNGPVGFAAVGTF